MKKFLPWIITAVFAIYAFGGLRPAPVKDFDWQKFGRIPAMANGRFQPLDSLARNSLLQLREKGAAISSTALKGPDKQRIMPATEWLAEVMFKPETAEVPRLRSVPPAPARNSARDDRLFLNFGTFMAFSIRKGWT